MRVTEDMTTEGGSPLAKLADFLGLDDTGVQVINGGDAVKILVDSTATQSKGVWLDPDDAIGVAWLIIQRATEVRGGDFGLVERAWHAARRRAADIGGKPGEVPETFVISLVSAFRDIDAAMGPRP